MATRSQSKSTKSSGNAGEDAIAALTADHKRVKALFKKFEDTHEDAEDEEKSELVRQICGELTVHTMLEEEIFYPAVRKAIDDADLMDEALVEHAGAKQLITQLEGMEPGDDLYDAKVTVLGEQIDHHVKEEEGELFPKVKKAKVDTASLGRKMQERRTQLMSDLGLDEGEGQAQGGSEADEEESGGKAGGRRMASAAASRKRPAARR